MSGSGAYAPSSTVLHGMIMSRRPSLTGLIDHVGLLERFERFRSPSVEEMSLYHTSTNHKLGRSKVNAQTTIKAGREMGLQISLHTCTYALIY